MEFKRGERVNTLLGTDIFIRYHNEDRNVSVVQDEDGGYRNLRTSTLSKINPSDIYFSEGESILHKSNGFIHDAIFDYYLNGFDDRYAHIYVNGRGKYVPKTSLTPKNSTNQSMKYILDTNY